MTEETGKTGETGRKGLLDWLETASLVIAGVSLIAVVAVQAWQVFARYVLNDSPSWTEPLALVFIAITAMFGAAVGARRETHFGFPLLADAAPAPIRAVCRALSRLAMAGLGAGLSFYGWVLTIDAWNVPMAGAPLPTGLRFLPVAIGGAVLALFALERLVRGFSEPASTSEAAPAAVAAEAA
jgi:TRAP-type C4-dicarboxylate transport system permease small subunit